MILNQNILKTLSILRKRIPKEMFKSNLKTVIAKRANLLEDFFESVITDFVDGEGEKINMPETHDLPPFEMYTTHALENLSAPDWIIFVSFAKCAPELATPAKSVPLS